jgi:hypothetical protein
LANFGCASISNLIVIKFDNHQNLEKSRTKLLFAVAGNAFLQHGHAVLQPETGLDAAAQ